MRALLMEGGFTLAAGMLGDLYGRKRILGITTVVFVLATLGCALAPSAPALIVLRGLQGLGGAALLSLPVAILVQMLPPGTDNEDTIKAFSTVAGLGAVAGPVLGGVLVHFWGWPAVFYLSVVMGVVMLATLPYVTESERDPSMRLDNLGQFLSILSFIAISFGLIEGNANGWASPIIVAAFIVFVAGIAMFIVVERRAPKPMIHLRYFSSRPFVAALLIIGIINFGSYGIMLLCTNFLQNVQHQLCMSACAAEDQGFASGAVALSRSLFGVFGIAILGTLLATGMASNIAKGLASMHAPVSVTKQVTSAVHHGGAFVIAQQPLPGVNAHVLTTLIEQSFVSGWHAALLVCAVLTLLFGVLIYILLPARKPVAALSP